MNQVNIDLIAGARPNFMKIAPIIRALQAAARNGSSLRYRLVHTGQHYDRNMSEQFFEQLGIPEPDVNLGSGSGTQAEQTARIMVAYEKLLMEAPADLCLVVGDVTSTLACSVAAKKLGIRVAHVEAGIRSYDLSMPEEINRMVTDSITDYFFTTSEVANAYLRKTGVEEDRILFVGNTMIDTLLHHRKDFRKPGIWDEARLEPGKFLVMTLHRPSNVDEESTLIELIQTIIDHSHDLPLVFPVHPRTRKVLERSGLVHPRLLQVDPLGYLEFNYLVERAAAVITDSGGITEETTVMGIPCMTLRANTERPETVAIGTNELLGTDPKAIPASMQKLFRGEWKKGNIPPLWDGHTADRIVAHLEKLIP